MSKIQEALARIQASKSASASVQRQPERQFEQVAAVVEGPDGSGNDDYTGRFVGVDRELLRQAGLLPPEDQTRHMADQYRLIKRPILDIASGKTADKPENANLVMIASALPGDGKTFNAINIALSLAVEKDTSVLLVDADVAKPHISRLFGVADEIGLIDLLEDQSMSVANAIMKTDVPRLSIMSAGHSNEHATELLASRRMNAVAAELSARDPNRIVVFDSPPLLATSESRVLASCMGQIVLVVCSDKTPQQAVGDALESLDEDKAINLVLNQAGSTMAEGYYGNFQYGYGYHSE